MTTLVEQSAGEREAASPVLPAGAYGDGGDPWARPALVEYAGRGARRRGRVAASAGAPPRRDAPRRSPGRARRLARRGLLALPAAGVAVVLLALAVPVLFGCRSLVVMSGSMTPAISTGSVVLVRRIPAEVIAVGEVISFPHPEDPGRVLTHRVQAVRLEAGRVTVQTKGDANTGTESWVVAPSGTVGRVVFHVPWLGYALAPLQGIVPRLLLVVVPAAGLAVLLLLDIWRTPAAARCPALGREAGPAGGRA